MCYVLHKAVQIYLFIFKIKIYFAIFVALSLTYKLKCYENRE